MEPTTPTPIPVPLATPIPTSTSVPTPTALLHPTLMEKLRLGSPTPAHTDLSTLNRYQTESEINRTLYGLQETSPFPKLPPYFVHPSETESARGSEAESELSTLKCTKGYTPPHAPRKKLVMTTTPLSTTTTATIAAAVRKSSTDGRPHSAGSSSKGGLSGGNSSHKSFAKQKGIFMLTVVELIREPSRKGQPPTVLDPFPITVVHS